MLYRFEPVGNGRYELVGDIKKLREEGGTIVCRGDWKKHDLLEVLRNNGLETKIGRDGHITYVRVLPGGMR